MVIYLDIILLLNVAIDTLLLWFTAYFRKERVVWWRILVASTLGSLYLLFLVFPALLMFHEWFIKLSFSLFMIWVAFGYHQLQRFFYNVCMFYFVAFVFGGGVFALDFFVRPDTQVVHGVLQTAGGGYGVGTRSVLLILAGGFLLVMLLSLRSYKGIQEPRKLAHFLVEVTVSIDGKDIVCRGLVDTGNRLYEPITRTPVMIVEQKLFTECLPEALAKVIEEENKLDKMDELMAAISVEWQGRLRLIPYRSVSRGMDFLLALKPDSVTIIQDDRRVYAVKVLVGLNPIALSADGHYQAIVHPALMQTDAKDPVKSIEQEGLHVH